MFDDMAIAQIRRLNDAWPQLLAPLQFAVEDVPLVTGSLGDESSSILRHFPLRMAFRPVWCSTACHCKAMHGPAWTCSSPFAMNWCCA